MYLLLWSYTQYCIFQTMDKSRCGRSVKLCTLPFFVCTQGFLFCILHVNWFSSVVAVFPPPPSKARITVLQMDVNTLSDGEELNDTIVDFFTT